MFSLAHFSDPHLAGWSTGGMRALMNKRVTGFLSWTFHRRKIHLSRVLDLLVADLKAQRPDHVALTGDIVNISAEDEFERAATWLGTWADPAMVSVIPGNHDAYVPVSWEKGIGLWSRFMAGSPPDREPSSMSAGEIGFPFVRTLGDIAIVGASSARPMPVFFAAGRIGAGQMQRLRMALMSLRRQGLFRVVLVHHPPFPAPLLRRRKALLDADAMMATLGECGAELVLHGHTHVAGLGRFGDVPVIGVPSASAGSGNHKDAAAYNIYRIARAGPRWRIVTEVRGLARDGGRFESKGRFTLDVGSPVHA